MSQRDDLLYGILRFFLEFWEFSLETLYLSPSTFSVRSKCLHLTLTYNWHIPSSKIDSGISCEYRLVCIIVFVFSHSIIFCHDILVVAAFEIIGHETPDETIPSFFQIGVHGFDSAIIFFELFLSDRLSTSDESGVEHIHDLRKFLLETDQLELGREHPGIDILFALKCLFYRGEVSHIHGLSHESPHVVCTGCFRFIRSINHAWKIRVKRHLLCSDEAGECVRKSDGLDRRCKDRFHFDLIGTTGEDFFVEIRNSCVFGSPINMSTEEFYIFREREYLILVNEDILSPAY